MSPKHVIYKKLSRDKSVGVYMGKRDFVDHCEFVDPVVYVMLSCTFRYGRDDMDVMGMAFRRDIFLCSRQVYPPLQDKERSVHTKVQEKILRKLGDNAYPFFFEFPDNLPCSVCLQPGPTDVGKPQTVFMSSVWLAIRKIQYAPDKGGAAPSAETTCEFIMSDKPLHMRVSLEKETYYHGEEINISVDIDNSSNRNLKDLSVSVEQVTNVVLYSNDKYVKTVAYEETTDTVPSGTSLKKVYTLCPLLDDNRDRLGLALDGKLKHEDTNLASSSIVKDEVLKEILGMLVAYRVVVKSNAAGIVGSSEVAVEVPFKLMHPKPDPGELITLPNMILSVFLFITEHELKSYLSF
ncbi:hypothetical protein cypCar_00020578 [Cyprinus carpio]|nr:hypothetical protein cypCar_00020578 [Cyprinus carpio]